MATHDPNNAPAPTSFDFLRHEPDLKWTVFDQTFFLHSDQLKWHSKFFRAVDCTTTAILDGGDFTGTYDGQIKAYHTVFQSIYNVPIEIESLYHLDLTTRTAE
jgi:hypothetical protein